MTLAAESQPGPTGGYRVIQLHPTRRCNLRCLHCYSESGPNVREELDLDTLCRTLDDAAAEGYAVAGFSGGEPTLYPELHKVLDHAHSCRMVTTVTTNGMLLTTARLDQLRGRVDLLAISLDGLPASHNHIRANPRAFGLMEGKLADVRASGIPFGFIFTLTQHNLNELEWVADFAVEQDARLLQIHPLEIAGRARECLAGRQPDATESTFAQLAARHLRERLDGRLLIQVDITDTRQLREHPERAFVMDDGAATCGLLSRIISPLVIETSGIAVPLQYGFPRAFALGNITETSLSELGERWRRDVHPAFRSLCRDVFDELTRPTRPRFANWYEAVAARARNASLADTVRLQQA